MYFITISEMLGTNGEKIARQVAKELNYTFYGEEELFKAADEMGFLSDIKKLGEKSPVLLERFFSEKPKIYLDRLQSVIYEVAKKGDAIFFGRGSQLLLHSFDCALHVLVTGSMEKRIKRMMEEKGVGRDVAEKLIHRSDHDKRGFIRFAFDEDWLNPHLYDLILNTDKLSIESAAKMIADGARSDEIKTCSLDSVNSLERLSLQRKVEAALLESDIPHQNLFVTVEDMESVRLYGFVSSSEEREKVKTIVKGIKGIKHITDDLSILKPSVGGV
ncbi:MAG: cytidylate kinase family protein [Thermodesulfobacteriota bacterium]|nr:cytidylate kinase family protein [Thermodesulfobacteriota bacterium]